MIKNSIKCKKLMNIQKFQKKVTFDLEILFLSKCENLWDNKKL